MYEKGYRVKMISPCKKLSRKQEESDKRKTKAERRDLEIDKSEREKGNGYQEERVRNGSGKGLHTSTLLQVMFILEHRRRTWASLSVIFGFRG